jgi:hypothetical protein
MHGHALRLFALLQGRMCTNARGLNLDSKQLPPELELELIQSQMAKNPVLRAPPPVALQTVLTSADPSSGRAVLSNGTSHGKIEALAGTTFNIHGFSALLTQRRMQNKPRSLGGAPLSTGLARTTATPGPRAERSSPRG